MLSAAQVRPFLLNDDDLVWKRALVYFAEAAAPSVLSADDVWGMVDRHGPQRVILRGLGRAAQTTSSVERLTQELVGGRSRQYLEDLTELASELPLEPLEALLKRPRSTSEIPGRWRAVVERRLVLSVRPFDDLWTELFNHAEYCDSQAERGDAYEPGLRIVEALARFGAASADRAMELFTKEATRESWLEVFLTELVGELCHEPAAAHLFDVVGRDGDLMNERAAHALGRIATDAVAREIVERYPAATEEFRIYVPNGVASMRTPGAESALVEILRLVEDDPERATFVADDLCDLATTEAFSKLVAWVEAGQFMPGITPLDEHVLALAIMLGKKLSWEEACRQRRREQEERVARRLQALTGLPGGMAAPASGNRHIARSWVSTSRKNRKRRGKKRG